MKDKNILNNVGKSMGSANKATLPNGENLSDKIKQNKVNNGVNASKNMGVNSSNTGATEGVEGNQSAINNKNNKKAKQNGGKTSTGLPDVQGMGAEAAREALKQAAGVVPYTRWIPKGIRDKIIDKFMDSDAGQALVEKAFAQIRMKIILAGVGLVCGVLLLLFIMAATLTLIMAPVAWIGDLLDGAGDFFEKLGNWFVGDGWCVESQCQSDAEKEYYETLDKALASDKFKNGCEINGDLITATIFYGQMVNEEVSPSDDKVEDYRYFDYLDVDEDFIDSPTAADEVNGLIKVYLKGKEIDSNDIYDNESGLVEVSECAKNVNAYRDYLINTYIKDHYNSAITKTRTVEDIADEILKMGGILDGGNLTFVEDTDGLFTMLPAGLNLGISSNPAHCRCHPVKHVWQSHKGVDIGGVPYGTEIVAFADGVVTENIIATSKSCGSSIIKLKHTNENGEVYYTRYVHLNRKSNTLLSNLTVGTNVSKGQVIGYVGGTVAEDSCSTGSHLHFEIHNSESKPINPVVALNNVKNGIDILANQEVIDTCAYNGGAC